MYLIIIFLLLCSGAILLSILFNKRIEITLPLWFFIIIIILYLFGLFNNLTIGVYVIEAIALVALIFSLYLFLKRKKSILKNIITPGFLVFILFFVLVWWAHRGRMLINWDEFTHWGLCVKNMFIFDALANHPDATSIFKNYPPASALFQYLWGKLSGNFIEGNLYRAINLFYFVLIIPIFQNQKFKKPAGIVFRIILAIILPVALFNDFYTSLLVDGLLGFLFAYALINHFTCPLESFSLINTGICLFVLTLTKESGAGLAAIAIVIIVVDILSNRNGLGLYIKNINGKRSIGRIAVLFSPLAMIFVSKYSWSVYLSITKADTMWSSGGPSIFSIFSNDLLGYQGQTISNFVTALTSTNLTDYTIKITFLGWFILLILLSMSICTFICKENEKNRFRQAFISLHIGIIIYCIGLLYIYLFKFSEYEALRLASYIRYIGTCLIGALTFLISIAFIKDFQSSSGEVNSIRCDNKKKISLPFLLLLVLLFITPLTAINGITVLAEDSIKIGSDVRFDYNNISRLNQVLNPEKDRVYFVSIADIGYDYWVARYSITPVHINDNLTWSIGEPYYEGDIWTQNISADEWSEQLFDNYTYVYIFKTNDVFNQNYGQFFENGVIQTDALYSIDKTNSTVMLKPVLY